MSIVSQSHPTRLARRLVVAAALVWAAAAQAAPLARDLGNGLTYVRVHAVPQDLPTDKTAENHGCVLDLRYAQGSAEVAPVLEAWLKFRATPRTPIFVLVNGSTAPALFGALGHRDATPGLLVIGVASQPFAPDITVSESATDERQAYDALEKGLSVSALTTDNPDKQRNDEASLARDRTAEPADADTSDTPTTATPSPKHSSPPLDAALQEALHVFQGLRAMKIL